MDHKKREEFVGLYIQMRQAADSLHTQAEEVYEMAKEIDEVTKDTTIRYATLKVRVEARAAFEQAKDLRRALEEMGKEMRGGAPLPLGAPLRSEARLALLLLLLRPREEDIIDGYVDLGYPQSHQVFNPPYDVAAHRFGDLRYGPAVLYSH
jgi:hypothetical protein